MSQSPLTQDLEELRHLCKLAGTAQALEDLGMAKKSGLMNWMAKPLGWLGKAIVGGVSQASPTAGRFLGRIGAGAARDATSFGLLGGGINAAMAEPDQRGQAFLKGFGTGALGGAAWRMGSNATRLGLHQALGPDTMRGLYNAGRAGGLPANQLPQSHWYRPSTWGMTNRGPIASLREGQYGQAAKGLGAKMITGGLPFAGAWGAASLTDPMQSTPSGSQQQQPSAYGPWLAGGQELLGS